MKIESTAILYLGIMFFLAVLFCKALESIVDRARRYFMGTNDVVDSIKMELNALHIKIDALKSKLDSKLDVLKTEVDALKTGFDTKLDVLKIEIDAVNSKAEPAATKRLSVVPELPTPLPENVYSNGEDSWTRGVRVIEGSRAPLIPTTNANDTWIRDTHGGETPESCVTAEKNRSA